MRLTQAEASAAVAICAIVAEFGRALEFEKDGRLDEGQAIRDHIEATLQTEDVRLIAGGALGALAALSDAESVASALWLDTTFAAELGEIREPMKIHAGILLSPATCAAIGPNLLDLLAARRVTGLPTSESVRQELLEVDELASRFQTAQLQKRAADVRSAD